MRGVRGGGVDVDAREFRGDVHDVLRPLGVEPDGVPPVVRRGRRGPAHAGDSEMGASAHTDARSGNGASPSHGCHTGPGGRRVSGDGGSGYARASAWAASATSRLSAASAPSHQGWVSPGRRARADAWTSHANRRLGTPVRFGGARLIATRFGTRRSARCAFGLGGRVTQRT